MDNEEITLVNDAPVVEPVVAAAPAVEPAAVAELPAVAEPVADEALVVDTAATEEPYALALPGMLTDDEADAHAPTLDSFAVAAHAAGLDQPVAQSLAGVYAQVSHALLPLMSRRNTVTGETEFSDLTDIDDMKAVTLQALGADAAAIHTAALAYLKTRPALAKYLDDSYLGNSPATLVALALAQENIFALSPAAAAVEMGKLTSNPRGAFYHAGPGHVVAVARASVLQSIVSEGAAFDAEVNEIREQEIATAEAARLEAERTAEERRVAAENAKLMAATVAEANLRRQKADELKARALAKARQDAADAAEARKAKAWATKQAPAASAVSAEDVSAARAEAASLIKSGTMDGSSPVAQAAKARFQQLLAQIS